MKRVDLRVPISDGLLVAALALAVTAVFFYEYLPPVRHVHIYSDIEGYHYPLHEYAFDSLKHGRFPQWDPSIYCGITFAGNVQAALLYPPAWLMYAAGWRFARLPFKALELFAFAHVWLAFVLAHLWLRRRRLGRLPCALGAAVFAWGGYMLSQIVHLGVVTGFAWMPLGFWGVDEAVRRRDWRPLWRTALASALCFLAGYPPSWLAFCATLVVYAAASPGRLRTAAALCGAIAGSVLLAAAEFLPATMARFHMFREERYGGGLDRLSDLLTLLVPNWFDYNRRSPTPDPVPYCLYLGLPAVFGLVWALRRARMLPYAQPLATALFCLVMATNPGFLVFRALAPIPLLRQVLSSGNFYEGLAAMAALFTALALHDFLERAPAPPARPWMAPLSALALLACGVRMIREWLHGGTFPAGIGSLLETALFAAVFAAALWTSRARTGAVRASLTALLLLMVAVDYKTHGTSRRFNTGDGDPDPIDDPRGIRGMNLAAFAALDSNRHYRTILDKGGGPYPTELRRWGPLATPQGFDPLLPARYRRAVESWTSFETNRVFFVDPKRTEMLQAFGVRFVVTHESVANDPFLHASPEFRLVAADDSFYRVYEYLHARPAFGWEDGSGEARPLAWTPERRVLAVRSAGGGRFHFVEQFYPGWRAAVDGRPAPIEFWQGAFQAIRVPPGEHTLEFRYRERLLPAGGVLSLAAFAALLLVALSDRRRRPAPDPGPRWTIRLEFGAGLRREAPAANPESARAPA